MAAAAARARIVLDIVRATDAPFSRFKCRCALTKHNAAVFSTVQSGTVTGLQQRKYASGSDPLGIPGCARERKRPW